MSRPKRLHFVVLTRELNAYAMHVVADRRNLLCYRCAEYGHRKAECMTWKTKLCWHHHDHAPTGECPFAHGERDLRCPWRIKCVRIVQCPQRGRVHIAGCGSSEHTYRDCPFRSDVEPAPRFPPDLPRFPPGLRIPEETAMMGGGDADATEEDADATGDGSRSKDELSEEDAPTVCGACDE